MLSLKYSISENKTLYNTVMYQEERHLNNLSITHWTNTPSPNPILSAWYHQIPLNPIVHSVLVGGIPTPLKNMSSSIRIIIPNIWKVIKKKHGSKPLSNYKWPCSIAMFVYQRVNPIVHSIPRSSNKINITWIEWIKINIKW